MLARTGLVRGLLACASALVCCLAVALVPGWVPRAAAATRLDAHDLRAELNSARVQAGLAPLNERAAHDQLAGRHADRMADAGGPPFHSEDPSAGVEDWEVVGEIVGRVDGGDQDWAATVTRAFLASRSHRDELLDPGYTELGVGASAAGNWVYVTGLLVRPAQPKVPPAPVGAPAGAAARPPVARPARSRVAAPPSSPPTTAAPAPPATSPPAPPEPPMVPPVDTVPLPVVELGPVALIRRTPAGTTDRVPALTALVLGVVLVSAWAPRARVRSR